MSRPRAASSRALCASTGARGCELIAQVCVRATYCVCCVRATRFASALQGLRPRYKACVRATRFASALQGLRPRYKVCVRATRLASALQGLRPRYHLCPRCGIPQVPVAGAARQHLGGGRGGAGMFPPTGRGLRTAPGGPGKGRVDGRAQRPDHARVVLTINIMIILCII